MRIQINDPLTFKSICFFLIDNTLNENFPCEFLNTMNAQCVMKSFLFFSFTLR